MVSPHMHPHTKNIATKYHQLWSFVTNDDVKIKYVNTMEQISDCFLKSLDSELLGYLRYKIKSW